MIVSILFATPYSPLKFRRRRTVEHVALRTLEQIDLPGFDRRRSALALERRQLFDPREIFSRLRQAAVSYLSTNQSLPSAVPDRDQAC
jgi:hypothetical protein